jgi:phosphoglycolate phosphatase
MDSKPQWPEAVIFDLDGTLAPSASFMVGDSVTDVETARAAGLAGIIVVSYGYTAIPARALGADAVIDHLDELPAAVLRLATTKS